MNRDRSYGALVMDKLVIICEAFRSSAVKIFLNFTMCRSRLVVF
jgi:hypothetical protein